MRTVDGKEAKIGTHYYLENGQEVQLINMAMTPEEDYLFLVEPYYEGEAMRASCDGGYHHEISAPYEFAGEKTLVKGIFESPPMEKLEKIYKNKLKEIENLSLAIGKILGIEQERKRKKHTLSRELSFVKNKIKEELAILKQTTNDLEKTKELLDSARNNLSRMEDQTASTTGSGERVTISKEELAQLREREFLLTCLEAGGVDNWEFYDISLDAYRERYPL